MRFDQAERVSVDVVRDSFALHGTVHYDADGIFCRYYPVPQYFP
jgi:hypothetical protein